VAALDRPCLWITGAGGLIGSHLVRTGAAAPNGWRVVGLVRGQLDLTRFDDVREAFRSQRPGLVIHCAGLKHTPTCEADPALARRLNVDVTACLADLAADIPFIFFSSDLVFDGGKGHYVETDPTAPWSVYSETKIAGERIVLANPRHTVVRVSLNGGVSPTGDRGFNEDMRRAWRAGRALTMFTDEFRSPIPAAVTARAVWELAAADRPGLYHLAGGDRLSRLELGQLIAARCPELNPRIEPGSRRDYSGPPRPADTSLDCAKIRKLLSFPLPGLREWLKDHPVEPF
jgi:dTDP-4-dehydrorhamnose reductase